MSNAHDTSDDRKIVIKWSGREFDVLVASNETVETVKRKLEEKTSVTAKRQKLMLKTKAGKPATDSTFVGDLLLKPGMKVLMLGTAEETIQALKAEAEVAPHIQDDFDLDERGLSEAQPFAQRPEILERLDRRIASVEPKVLNPPRIGKKLLVLDIDYTIFDLGSAAERPEELARPYLHEFLSSVYQHYDISIWSATSMKWIEVKMKELGVSTHPDYKITFFLDHKAMLTVKHPEHGLFDCKPLQFIWAKWQEYGPHNTIMFDDLRRNYIMNEQNGLVISPYRKSYKNREVDKELLHLKRYLLKIAALESLAHLKHKRWRQYISDELEI